MDSVPSGLPAESDLVMTGCYKHDRSVALFDLQKKRRENQKLEAEIQERKQVLESLPLLIHEKEEEIQRVEVLCTGSDLLLKEKFADQAAEKGEREMKERLQKEADLKRLRDEFAELIDRKQEQQRQVQRHSVYRDFMERVVKMTKFEDVQPLTGHLESLLHFRDQLYQNEIEGQEQTDLKRKVLLTLEDHHHLQMLLKNNQLSQLQTELENTRSEALTWERKWNRIQETAAKKTLLLGQIKMATLNLHEMTDNEEAGEEPVDMNDTEKQLDKVKMFIQDHSDIVRQHQTPSQRQEEGLKKEMAKKEVVKKPVRIRCSLPKR